MAVLAQDGADGADCRYQPNEQHGCDRQQDRRQPFHDRLHFVDAQADEYTEADYHEEKQSQGFFLHRAASRLGTPKVFCQIGIHVGCRR